MDDVKHFFKPLSLQFEKQFFFSRTFNIRPEDYLIISVSSYHVFRLESLSVRCIINAEFPICCLNNIVTLLLGSFQDKGNVCLGVFDGTAIGYDSVIIVGGIQWSFS